MKDHGWVGRDDEARCRNCQCQLHGKNAKDVGYCVDCFNAMMCDGDEDESEEEDETTIKQ